MKKLLAACLVFSGATVWATEYFVSKERPDDSGDGKTVATAKRTIQAAVDLAQKGDIVTVLPGVYDEGEGETYNSAALSADANARVVLSKSIWLRSLEGKEKTFIVGSSVARGDEKDLRCVALATSSTIVEGFTLCGGAAPDSRGGGVLAEGWDRYYIADCIISNNTARIAGGTYRGSILRCLIAENTANNTASACRQTKAIHTVIRHNYGPSSTISYSYKLVNCTVFENRTDTTENYHNAVAAFYNCVFSGNTGRIAYDKQRLFMTNCVVDRAESEFENVADCVFKPEGHQFLAPVYNDLRLLDGSVSATAGMGEWLENYTLDAPAVPEWGEYLEAKYRYNDFDGNPIAKTGKIHCGALHPVLPKGGRVDFGGSDCVWNPPCNGAERAKANLYAYAQSYPTQFCAKAQFNSGKSLFMYQFSPSYDIYCFFPEMDGYFRFVPPPLDSSVTLKPVAANDELYVDAENGDDANDGSSKEKAFETLQAAINHASDVYDVRTLIHVAPGTYDKGGTFSGSLSNRVDNLKKTLYIRAEEGPEKTFIVGAVDPDTKGYGPNAMRCVKWFHSGRLGCLQGFTLTGGYTDDGDRYAESRIAAAYYGSFEHLTDCIISNNHAICASATMSGVITRCRIFDNTAKVSWAVSTPKAMSYCLLKGNKILAGEDAAVTRGGVYRFCTVEGVGFQTVGETVPGTYYGCVFERAGSTYGHCSFEDCFAGAGSAQTEVPGVEIVDLHMDKDGGRLLSISPAYGAVSLENPAWHYSYFTSDMDGISPYWKGAAMTAGAFSRPLQAFSVKGPKDSLSVTGTNGVAFAQTVSVTAKESRPGSGEAKFLGFTVDGVQLPAEQLTCEVSGGDPEGIIEIIANYLPRGLKMILR